MVEDLKLENDQLHQTYECVEVAASIYVKL